MIYLIYGPPCGGKSTYITNHMKRGDLVCDVDLLFAAISNQDLHNADLYIHEIALQLKENLLDIIKNRQGTWNDAYVVSLANTPQKLEKAMKRINADQCVFMNTPYQVCLERAEKRGEPFLFSMLIHEWFQTSTFDNIEK